MATMDGVNGAQQSLIDIVRAQVDARPDATAALVKRDGRYQGVSWAELWSQAEAVARALIAAGIEVGDRVNLIAHTGLEWVVCDLGILAAGAVTVPIYPSNLPDECLYVAEHSGARLVLAEDREQVAKFLAVRDQLGEVGKVVQLSGTPDTGGEGWVEGFADFLAAGESVSAEQLAARLSEIRPEAILTIIYTSGTTGRPKGVVLTHANMLYEARAVRELELISPDDIQLLFLPLAHSFAKVLEVGWLATGHVLAFAESMQTIRDNLGEVRPTLMAGVPRVFEKFYAAVVDKGLSAGGVAGRLFAKTLALSAAQGERELAGEPLGLVDALAFAALKKLVLAKVRAGVMQTLGGRMRIMLSGGAPLARKIAWFFRDAEIEVLEGYGMTETAAGTTVNRPGANQIGTVGPPLPGSRARIADDGEILLHGPGIMREYWRNPEATAETFTTDGWLRTGDIGSIDGRTGALIITDRKKDLIITAGGKNIAPQRIENLVKASELISQCVVHGDRRKYLSALLTLEEAQLLDFAAREGLEGSYAALAEDPRVRREVERIVADANAQLASYETIKKFTILAADFSIESGELTPKLSVKRKVVNSKYGHLFDGFYAEDFQERSSAAP